MESNGTCNGSDQIIIANTYCLVSISTLITSPFNLPWGASIFVKVLAMNLVGSSAYSTAANGAVIFTSPDAPQTLSNNVQVTSMSQIGLTWYEGASNGGSPVIDYRLWYTYGSLSSSVLASGITTTSYIATSLTAGITYTFKV